MQFFLLDGGSDRRREAARVDAQRTIPDFGDAPLPSVGEVHRDATLVASVPCGP